MGKILTVVIILFVLFSLTVMVSMTFKIWLYPLLVKSAEPPGTVDRTELQEKDFEYLNEKYSEYKAISIKIEKAQAEVVNHENIANRTGWGHSDISEGNRLQAEVERLLYQAQDIKNDYNIHAAGAEFKTLPRRIE